MLGGTLRRNLPLHLRGGAGLIGSPPPDGTVPGVSCRVSQVFSSKRAVRGQIMGKRGPAPRPTHLRVLDGNPSKRPLNGDEPMPDGAPTCPTILDKEAKQEWKRIEKS